MSWSLLGRFFGVPFLIIALIVGGAVAVVLLFGGPGTPQRYSIEELLSSLESSTGERTGAILLPREKELWLMALELSGRLEKRDSELTVEELTTVATRIAAMVRRGIEELSERSAGPSTGASESKASSDLWSRRLEFLIHALGRTGRREAVEPLIEVVRSGHEPHVAAATLELGNLAGLPEAREAVGPIVALLKTSRRAETTMVACTALSVLADRGSGPATEALRDVLHGNEGETAWSAALALARLGDPSAKSTLMEMLDRGFWERGDRYQTVDEKGNVLRYPMPPQRVEAYLLAALEAAWRLDDRDLWGAIDRLKSDSSPRIRGKADEVSRGRISTENR